MHYKYAIAFIFNLHLETSVEISYERTKYNNRRWLISITYEQNLEMVKSTLVFKTLLPSF